MAVTVLAINAGSSSLKFAGWTASATGLELLFRGGVDLTRTPPRLKAAGPNGEMVADHVCAAKDGLAGAVLDWAIERLGRPPDVVGHRVVHGGPAFRAPVRIDIEVMRALEALCDWAPLHQPKSLEAIRVIAGRWPELAQAACFDTAFHADLPSVAAEFALPRALSEAGIRRYGFHGLSYAHIADRLPALAPGPASGRVIAAHLGAGASLCALKAGRSVDTTMGFSPLDGLPMATRCGSLDPGVVLHLQTCRGLSAEAVSELLYHRSGLLGVSGISGDMRTLLASAEPRAQDAVEMFVYRTVREAGALTAVLGGLDALVFTGGVGENAAPVRAAVGQGLAWLGVAIDPQANAAGPVERPIHLPASSIPVWVIPADEERVIAGQSAGLIAC